MMGEDELGCLSVAPKPRYLKQVNGCYRYSLKRNLLTLDVLIALSRLLGFPDDNRIDGVLINLAGLVAEMKCVSAEINAAKLGEKQAPKRLPL
jgi:hypothetical protein